MSNDPRLSDLLRQWQQLRAAGQTPSAEELCRDTPELITEFKGLLSSMAAFDRQLAIDQAELQTQLPPEGGPKNLPPAQYSATATYRELEFLDAGGLGEVFRAREFYRTGDGSHGRRVALKFVKREWMHDPECRARFEREADITGRLDHPGIVPVYGTGEASDGRPFYAMRLIHGEKLLEAIDRFHKRSDSDSTGRAGRFKRGTLLRHLISTANTIAYAHHRGVAHLDIKPANIMIGRYGETLVVDWGLATPIEEAHRYQLSAPIDHLTGMVDSKVRPSATGRGTLPYMSPEQCDDAWAEVGPPSDIYALGVTLYYVLTGRLPFTGHDFARDFRDPKKRGDFIRPCAVDPEIPKALEAICVKAMEPRPENRYARATDFAADLERWLADEPVSVRDEGRLERLARLTRRHYNWAISLAAAVVIVSLVSVAAAMLLARRADREHKAKENETEARLAAEEAQVVAHAARDSSLRMAARFAARTVASEIDLRLRILEASAGDGRLRELLIASEGQPRDSMPRKQLQAWIENAKKTTQDSTKADSWFVNNAEGVQLARADFDLKTIDKSFAYRDYFHGQGLDLNESDMKKPQTPIREPYLSNVYSSKSNGHLKIAFSVPIWKDADDRLADRPPLGVLSLSVDAGEFRVLELGLDTRQSAALVDLRPDVCESIQKRGIVLHHPQLLDALAKQLASDDGFHDLPRLTEDRVKQLDSLRTRRMLQVELKAPIERPLAGSLDHAYRDALSVNPEQLHLAVFEPVTIPWRSEPRVRDTGWVVIVEERIDSPAPVHSEVE